MLFFKVILCTKSFQFSFRNHLKLDPYFRDRSQLQLPLLHLTNINISNLLWPTVILNQWSKWKSILILSKLLNRWSMLHYLLFYYLNFFHRACEWCFVFGWSLLTFRYMQYGVYSLQDKYLVYERDYLVCI